MSLKEKINLVKEQLGISEIDTQALEKSSGKKLVDYESIDALVADLMEYYNGELKKKAASSHTHDDRYFTESEINEKFKNFCPFPIGSVLPMWNETNPTSLYLGTTWEVISAGKYVQTGNTALQTGGSNSITIAKDNLPNIKINTTSATATINSHFHYTFANASGSSSVGSANYPAFRLNDGSYEMYRIASSGTVPTLAKTSNSGNGTTGSFTLQTEALGSGTPITIRPNYITLKFWKRLS